MYFRLASLLALAPLAVLAAPLGTAGPADASDQVVGATDPSYSWDSTGDLHGSRPEDTATVTYTEEDYQVINGVSYWIVTAHAAAGYHFDYASAPLVPEAWVGMTSNGVYNEDPAEASYLVTDDAPSAGTTCNG